MTPKKTSAKPALIVGPGRIARSLSEAVKSPRTDARVFHGSCACGAVRFLVTLDPATATPCICSRCRGSGIRIAHAQGVSFRLLTGYEDLTEPIAEARMPHHFFCARCGEPTFGGIRSGDGPKVISVNTACLSRGVAADVVPEAGC